MNEDDYKRDAVGRLVPIDSIRPIDLTRDALVREIVRAARELNEHISDFKEKSFGDIAAFVQLSAEQYDAKLGGTKGNLTLMSFDGKYKVQRAIAEHLVFDERLEAAKELIEQCIREWSVGARSEIQALVNGAFQVDQKGNINTARVLSLRRLKIDNEKWIKAMQAISDAVTVSGSKSYVRIYERVGDTDQYKPIPLDVAGV